MVVPFSGIEEFDHNKTTYYPKTIFRFPLEVFKIAQSKKYTCELYHRVQIAPNDQVTLNHQRTTFKEKLTTQHNLHPFKISECITNVTKFDVSITDTASQQLQQCVS